jgi:deoxyribose-phosphate aldolase
MRLTGPGIARMVDLSAVRADDNDDTIRELVRVGLHYQVCLVTTLPLYTALAKELLGDTRSVGLSGNVGFPDGGHTTSIKVAETRELLRLGVTEIDMVISLGHLLSGRTQPVVDDINAVVQAAEGRPVKAIIECHYLTDVQIRLASELCVQGGAAFVKTGTGWAPTGATVENVRLIKSAVGDRALIKASGGVRSLETIIEMYRSGATRFGIGLKHAVRVLDQCQSLPAGGIQG